MASNPTEIVGSTDPTEPRVGRSCPCCWFTIDSKTSLFKGDVISISSTKDPDMPKRWRVVDIGLPNDRGEREVTALHGDPKTFRVISTIYKNPTKNGGAEAPPLSDLPWYCRPPR